jgi:Histidine kinase-, DNA gyrase B-, and HSP90-like ATPase
MSRSNVVNIRPNVSILSILKFVEYETWFALAEFVDNSIVSFQTNENRLKEIHGNNFKLEVKIEIDDVENKIVIRDNAAGIAETEYSRAFRAAEIPSDTSGLSEFGMGMKSAACWFSDLWSVRTTALGEPVERTIKFDIAKIVDDKMEAIEFESKSVSKELHYTVIELYNVDKIPRKKGLSKVRAHLSSIYRDFLKKNILSIVVDGETLSYVEPNILYVPRYDDPKGQPILWKKEIDFTIDDDLSVHGFVAIREKGSTSEAGFALFRRGRVIEGSFDNTFRPDFIFGSTNSFRYQRIFGELHLKGFDVSFTKKGVQWDDNLDVFLKLLKEDISHKTFPLYQQAEEYRVKATEAEYKAAGKILDAAVNDIEAKLPDVIQEILNESKEDINPYQEELIETSMIYHREFSFEFNRENWQISIELSFDPSLSEMIEIGDRFIPSTLNDKNAQKIGIRLSLVHPFMIQFAGADGNKIEPILRIIAAFGLSEVLARRTKIVGDVRRNFNQIINRIT